MDPTSKAMTNRSIRTIRAELEFLADSSLLNPSQLSAIIALLPDTSNSSQNTQPQPASLSASLSNISLNEKQPANFYAPSPSPAPPPAYGASNPVATASALHVYTPMDAGDLALAPNDHIQVLEFINADWAKGRNERTGQEGIFPRSYVSILDQKSQNSSTSVGMMAPSSNPQQSSSYGNLPLAVSQSGSAGEVGGRSKFDENGKKFGKKLGNAAIFGAGATIGSNIVNGIF